MLLPRHKELQFKDYDTDYMKPSGGVYVEDGQDLYSNLNYGGSTMDTRTERPNNFQRKPSYLDDMSLNDREEMRAPPALKNRSAISQRPAGSSLLASAGGMQVGSVLAKVPPAAGLHASSLKSGSSV